MTLACSRAEITATQQRVYEYTKARGRYLTFPNHV